MGTYSNRSALQMERLIVLARELRRCAREAEALRLDVAPQLARAAALEAEVAASGREPEPIVEGLSRLIDELGQVEAGE